ncbi:matrixin family metalloprotease [Patescibacteria group bacterium]|nr:matrixin family metalloprotease [Patescibacteria group bacterium]
MRSSFIIVLIATILFSGAHWYIRTEGVCPVPLKYRLGSYDERFLLSPDEVKQVIGEAEVAWEEAVGRELFIYDESADFVVDFVFDERQRRAESEEESRQRLNEQEERTSATRAAIAALEADFSEAKEQYETRTRVYERDLGRYNAEIEAINARGGADERERTELAARQRAFAAEERTLESMAKNLNTLIEQINELGSEGNMLVEQYNEEVAVYNDRYGEAGAFTQGEYADGRITIYKYSDTTELRQVMAHEFGHALGADHVEDNQAILYYLLEQQPDELTLTPSDVSAVALVCGEGDEFSHRLRHFIRTALSLLT